MRVQEHVHGCGAVFPTKICKLTGNIGTLSVFYSLCRDCGQPGIYASPSKSPSSRLLSETYRRGSTYQWCGVHTSRAFDDLIPWSICRDILCVCVIDGDVLQHRDGFDSEWDLFIPRWV